MAIKATTPHPDEVRKHFADYADILDIYASDQIASLRWKSAMIRAKLYAELAAEMRAIVFEEGPLESDD